LRFTFLSFFTYDAFSEYPLALRKALSSIPKFIADMPGTREVSFSRAMSTFGAAGTLSLISQAEVRP
jgi:hypothetical protein